MKSKLLLYGGKFEAKLIISILGLENFEYTVFDNKLKKKFFKGKYHFINSESELNENISSKNFDYFFICIGDNLIRKKVSNLKILRNLKSINVFDKKNTILHYSKIGIGNLIYPGCNIDYFVNIGNFNTINRSTTITHDVVIGNYNFFGPNVTILGSVKIGQNVFIGAGSVIEAGVNICDNVIIGANSFVNKNIDLEGMYFGTPMRFYEKK